MSHGLDPSDDDTYGAVAGGGGGGGGDAAADPFAAVPELGSSDCNLLVLLKPAPPSSVQ